MYFLLQFLKSQFDEKEKYQQNFLIEKLNMEDAINEYKRKNELLKLKLKSYEIEWEKEMKISNENNQKIIKFEDELKENKSFSSLSKIQNENLIIENDDLKKAMKENKCLIIKLEERALMSEEYSKEWEEKYNVLESTHVEHSSKQKEREKSLSEQLEVNIRRGDNAENDLQKHKELISFINKLSTEGEAGRAKARRLSEAVCHDNNNNLKSQNKENIYKNDNSNSNNENNNSCNDKSNSNKGISDDYDDDKYDSRYEERSRKVRKPSKS